MTFSSRQRYPHFIQRETASSLTLDLYADATRVTPTSLKISVYDGSGNLIVDGATVTPGAPSTYTISAVTLPDTLAFSEDWVVEWSGSYSSTDFLIREDAHLVLRRLYPVVQQATLLSRHFDLADLLPTGKTSWQDEIEEAWARIIGELVGKGQMPYLVMTPWVFRDLHIDTALALIFREISTHTGSGRYSEMASDYEDRARKDWDRITLKYDTAQSGVGGSADKAQASPVVLLSGTARRHWR